MRVMPVCLAVAAVSLPMAAARAQQQDFSKVIKPDQILAIAYASLGGTKK